jgi:hypothetical protein
VADGLDQLDERRKTAAKPRRYVPEPKHEKAATTRNDVAPTPVTPPPAAAVDQPPDPAPAVVEPPAATERPLGVPQRRSRVRPTQVHLDEASEEHLAALKKLAVLADVTLSASAVLRQALAEYVERHGYDEIINIFAADDRAGAPQPKKAAARS